MCPYEEKSPQLQNSLARLIFFKPIQQKCCCKVNVVCLLELALMSFTNNELGALQSLMVLQHQ